jgi:hypothetical protein
VVTRQSGAIAPRIAQPCHCLQQQSAQGQAYGGAQSSGEIDHSLRSVFSADDAKTGSSPVLMAA